MKKKSFTYSDLSNKALQNLKEYYVNKKVSSMCEKELKEFVTEIITHQIQDTIGKEEEIEAWKEMSDFFDEEFDKVIIEMQEKYNDINHKEIIEKDTPEHRQELLEKNNIEKEKEDMWAD